LRVNGKAYTGTWIPWSLLKTGATLQFVLSETPNKSWGLATAPPSFE